MSLRIKWHFLWVPCYRTESTNLCAPFPPCSFSPLQKESEKPFRLCLWPFGSFLCLFSTLPSEYCVCMYVCMICASELWLMQIVFFSRKKFLCMLHAVCAPADTLELSERMCVHWHRCTFNVACVCLHLYSIRLPQTLIVLLVYTVCVSFLPVAADSGTHYKPLLSLACAHTLYLRAKVATGILCLCLGP